MSCITNYRTMHEFAKALEQGLKSLTCAGKACLRVTVMTAWKLSRTRGITRITKRRQKIWSGSEYDVHGRAIKKTQQVYIYIRRDET